MKVMKATKVMQVMDVMKISLHFSACRHVSAYRRPMDAIFSSDRGSSVYPAGLIMPAQPSVHPGIVNVQDQAQPGTVSAQKTASIAATAPLLTVKVTNLFNYTI